MLAKLHSRYIYAYIFFMGASLLFSKRTSAVINFSKQVEEIGADIYGNDGGDIKDVIANIIRIILGFVGTIFLLLIIWGGMQWMLSGGNEQKIEEAKKRIANATIGLVIIVCAYAIASAVVKQLGKAVGNGSAGGSNTESGG